MNSVLTNGLTKIGKIRQLDHPPYKIVGELKPFPLNMRASLRSRQDHTFTDFVELKPKSAAETIKEGKPGYSRVDFALQLASRTVVSAMSRQAYSRRKIDKRSSGVETKYIPDDVGKFTNEVKRAARLYGASVAGITRLDRRWIYSAFDGNLLRIPDELNTAIVMGVEMNRELIKQSPSALASAAVGNGYSRMVFTTACLAEFLRDLGWQAIGCGNDTALSIPLAIDAGLGEFGRNGLLITPDFGSRLRLCKIFTDAPLVPDKPIEFGVVNFCTKCGRCASACPAGAINAGEQTSEAVCPSNNPGVLKWPVHAEKCLRFWRTNGTSCANCISSCPLSQ